MSDHKGEIVGSEPGEWSDVSGRRKAARREREKWLSRRGRREIVGETVCNFWIDQKSFISENGI